MQYKMFLLTAEETRQPLCCGLAYAMKNESRWIDSGVTDPENHFSTYDAGRTFFMYNDKAYMISRDYIMPEKGVRLYILTNRNLKNDQVNDEEG